MDIIDINVFSDIFSSGFDPTLNEKPKESEGDEEEHQEEDHKIEEHENSEEEQTNKEPEGE